MQDVQLLRGRHSVRGRYRVHSAEGIPGSGRDPVDRHVVGGVDKSMAKILFINPVVREEDVPRHVPYGIALLAAIAMQDGHLVQIYDENAWRKGGEVMRQVCEAD